MGLRLRVGVASGSLARDDADLRGVTELLE